MNGSDELHWEDDDPYLIAYRRRQEEKAQAAWTADLRPWDELNALAVPPRDEYAERARELLSRSAPSEPGGWALAAEQAHRDYEQRQKEAQFAVRMAEKLGEEVPPEIRARAETPSAHLQVEAMLEQRAENRRQALRQATTPTVGRNDGTFAGFSDDRELAFTREATLNSYGQIRRHRAMAEGNAEPVRAWWRRRK